MSAAWRTAWLSPTSAADGIVAVTIPVVEPCTNQHVVVLAGAACGAQNESTRGLSCGTRTLPAGLYARKLEYA